LVETIQDGATGTLVPPGDAEALATAVGRLVDHAELRQRMGEAGRSRARAQFTWPHLAAQVKEIYRQLAPGTLTGH
jgi:glycosyltransferase involved in cell wall biosynthesis